jgi:hypothetical protein
MAFGQIPTLSFENLESQNLKGKVKLVKTRSFNANKVNGAFVKTTKGWQYPWENEEEVYFNTQGYLELKKEMKNGTTSVSYSIKLDDKNRIVQIDESVLTYHFKYDSLNNIRSAKEIIRDKHIESVFKYDYNDKKSLVKKEEYLTNQLISTETFSYDTLKQPS